MSTLLQVVTLVALAAAPLVGTQAADQPGTMFAPIVRTENTGGGVIRIVYDLRGASGPSVAVVLEASNDGGQSFTVRPRALTGDVGARVSPGAEKSIVWDSTKDVDDLQVDRYVYRVRVTASGPNAAVASPPAAPAATGTTANGRGTTAAKKGGLGKGALIGIIGGGAGAAAVGLSASKGSSSASPSTPSTPSTPPPSSGSQSFSGTSALSATLTTNFRNPATGGGCTRVEAWTGTLRLDFQILASNAVTGTASGSGTIVTTFTTCSGGPQANASSTFTVPQAQVTGNTGAIAFRFGAGPVRSVDLCCNVTYEYAFTGTLSSNVVNGTLTYNVTIQPDNSAEVGTGTASFTVSAR